MKKQETEEIKQKEGVVQEEVVQETTQTNEKKTAEQSVDTDQKENSEKTEDDMKQRIAELEKAKVELQDQYLRKAADFDNYRKRMIREKQEAIDYANTNLLSDLVRVLDDFDRAIQSGSALEQGTPGFAFAEGVSMIRGQLGSMLESSYGLQYYPSKGAPFDPNIHEAVSSISAPNVKEPTVSEEIMKGYRLKDRIIRIAKVAVSMPVQDASAEAQDEAKK